MKSKYTVFLAAYCMLTTSVALASSPSSIIDVYATNCAKGTNELKINVAAYNGDDSSKTWPYDAKYKLAYGSTASLECDNGGQGRCKIRAKVNSGSMKDWENIDENRYAYVVKEGNSLKIYEKTSETACPD